MIINTDVKVVLSPDQVDTYIWYEMDAQEQSELLKWLGYRYYGDTGNMEKQLCYISEEFAMYEDFTRERTIKFLESLLGWLKKGEGK